MAKDDIFIKSLAEAFAKTAGSTSDDLSKKIDQIRAKVSVLLDSINPQDIGIDPNSRININNLLAPPSSPRDIKFTAATKLAYQNVVTDLLRKVRSYIRNTNNLFTGQASIDTPIKALLGADRKSSAWTGMAYNKAARTLLRYITDYVSKSKNMFSSTGTPGDGVKISSSVLQTILDVKNKRFSFSTNFTYQKSVRTLLNSIQKYVTENSNIFEGGLDPNQIIQTLLSGGDNKFSFFTRRKYNAAVRILLDKVVKYVNDPKTKFSSGKLDITALLGDVTSEASFWTKRKYNSVVRNLLGKISNAVDEIKFTKKTYDPLTLLDIPHISHHTEGIINKGYKNAANAYITKLMDTIKSDDLQIKVGEEFKPFDFINLTKKTKDKLAKRLELAIEKYIARIERKLIKGQINLKAFDIPDDYAKTILEKANITARKQPSVDKKEYATEESAFQKTAEVDVRIKNIDTAAHDALQKIFCGCIEKFKSNILKSTATVAPKTEAGGTGDGILSTLFKAVTGGVVGRVGGSLLRKIKTKFGIGGKAAEAVEAVEVGAKATKAAEAVEITGKAAKAAEAGGVAAKAAKAGGTAAKATEAAGGLAKVAGAAGALGKVSRAVGTIAKVAPIIDAAMMAYDIYNIAEDPEKYFEELESENLNKSYGSAVWSNLGKPVGSILGVGKATSGIIQNYVDNKTQAQQEKTYQDKASRVAALKAELGPNITKEQRLFINKSVIQENKDDEWVRKNMPDATPKENLSVPRLASDYSNPVITSPLTANRVSETKTVKEIKKLNQTINTLTNGVISNASQATPGGPTVMNSGTPGNAGGAAPFSSGGFREPAYEARLSTWSRLRPGSIIS